MDEHQVEEGAGMGREETKLFNPKTAVSCYWKIWSLHTLALDTFATEWWIFIVKEIVLYYVSSPEVP